MSGKEDQTDFCLDRVAMSDREFAALSALLHSFTGITLPLTKKNMLISRLLKRLKVLHLKNFSQYYELTTTPEGRQSEFSHAIDLVSTNKTEFFREPGHFELLYGFVLPQVIASKIQEAGRSIEIWSAGCSSGEEPYSIGMVVEEFTRNYQSFRFKILATDISRRILEQAQYAVYRQADIEAVPAKYISKYFWRGKQHQSGKYRIAPELRNRITFQYLNLMESSHPFRENMDIIFCRNVMIYFDSKNRYKSFSRRVQDTYM